MRKFVGPESRLEPEGRDSSIDLHDQSKRFKTIGVDAHCRVDDSIDFEIYHVLSHEREVTKNLLTRRTIHRRAVAVELTTQRN